MWMSSMTSGVKMRSFLRRARACCRVDAVAFFGDVGTGPAPSFPWRHVTCFSAQRSVLTSLSHAFAHSEHELLFGRLEVVVIPELFAGDDLLHVPTPSRRVQAVHA